MSTKLTEIGDIRFKSYAQDVVINLPVCIEELVQDNVLAQIINKIVEHIPIKDLALYYAGGGRPPYHPRMLIKVWIYAYCSKIYTSRPLAKRLREDLVFIWLAGGQRPCFKTLSAFRSCRMQDLVDTVLQEVLLYLVEHNYIDLTDLYIDGSKWEANANKHKIVWRKNTERYKANVIQRISSLLQEAKVLQQEEDAAYGGKDLAEHQSSAQVHLILDSEALQAKLCHLQELIEQQTDKKRKRSLAKVRRHLSKEQLKLEKYEQQEQTLAARNSYSKTDEDATALRMKDDRLLPGYNAQITTSEQFIINATIHQNASDSPTLPPHVEQLEKRISTVVQADQCIDFTADAGYGSEENYELLKSKGHQAYIKYPLWYQEVSGQLKKKLFNAYNWYYNAEQDYYQCPNNKKLYFKEEVIKTSRNGYERNMRVYESEGCANCPLYEQCRSPRAIPNSNRTVWRSEKLEVFKKEVKQRLDTDKGLQKRSQRGVDVETPFANIKYNMAHRRFVLRGIEKVNIEFQFLAIAHNLKKIYCEQTGIWQDHYAQRAARSVAKRTKRA